MTFSELFLSFKIINILITCIIIIILATLYFSVGICSSYQNKQLGTRPILTLKCNMTECIIKQNYRITSFYLD